MPPVFAGSRPEAAVEPQRRRAIGANSGVMASDALTTEILRRSPCQQSALPALMSDEEERMRSQGSP